LIKVGDLVEGEDPHQGELIRGVVISVSVKSRSKTPGANNFYKVYDGERVHLLFGFELRKIE